MGYPKSRLLLGHETFLQKILAEVSSVASKVIVVGGAFEDVNDCAEFARVICVEDQYSDRGPIEGIRVGLNEILGEYDVAFLTGCDTPLVSANLIRGLHEHLSKMDCVVPKIGKQIYGTTAIYRTTALTTINTMVANNEFRVQDLVNALKAGFVEEADLRKLEPDLDSFRNINSPDEYFELLKQLDYECPEDIRARLAEF